MRRQWAKLASGMLAWGISCAAASAQPPASSGESYYDANDPYYNNLETGWQWRFQADWVALKRTNRASDLPAMIGPDAFRLKDVDFNYKSGYRLNLGFMNDDYELEGSFLELDGLSGHRGGVLANPLVFDGATTFGLAPGAAAVGATPNFLSASTLFSPLVTAANTNAAGADESTELEFLTAGSLYTMHYDSALQDFDINFKNRRQPGRLFRFGLGYRNIQFREFGRVDLRGLFDTVDSDDGLEPDANDALSNGALTGAGLTNSVAATGFTDTLPPPPPTPIVLETLLFTNQQRADNQLNGVQLTCDATFFESDYFELGGIARAGVYHNRARVALSERYLDVTSGATYSRAFADEKDTIAFAGNLGITGVWILRENLRVFASYETLFLAGVALAPNQTKGLTTDIAGNTFLEAQANGSAFLHGGRLGFEILLP